jgi:hypothetical protein
MRGGNLPGRDHRKRLAEGGFAAKVSRDVLVVPATENRVPIDLQQQFGQIDIYLFDQLLRGRIRPVNGTIEDHSHTESAVDDDVVNTERLMESITYQK